LLVKTAAGMVGRRSTRETTTVERELLTVWVSYLAGAPGARGPSLRDRVNGVDGT
jgi:hypothetical protein